MEEKFRIGEHIVDHLEAGEKTTSGDPILDEWQRANPENKNDLENYRKIWDGTAGVAQLQKFDNGKGWNNVNSKLERKNTRIRQLKNIAFVASGMAASLLIFLSLSFYTNLFSTSGATFAMSTTYGSRSDVILPDGSLVKLNVGSNLTYHFDRIQKTRQVNFSGEAFFEVAKTHQPFVIHTPDGLNVKVLGTKFNLSSYPEDSQTQTSLVEGSVELSHSGSASLILKPGQIASFNKNSNELKFASGEVSQSLGWMQNKLYMEYMSLQEVCLRLERWYDVDITLSKASMGQNIHYTGVLQEQSVMDVLNAMCELSAINYQLKGKNIIISER
ncbi:MAG TPA: FecR domain-containing protein [Prolixibacteraceae bacterium]|nr:FecR domain-containing protein [Prolixibacteraceae bacterium]